MSKINILKNGELVDVIDNKITSLNKHIVTVDVKYIKELEKHKIPYNKFHEDFYICTRGKKKKKFNKEQANYIERDLIENEITIRDCAKKYKCSPKVIQSIKNGTYYKED